MSTYTIQEPPHGDKPDPVDRLRQILQRLPETELGIVLEGVAANLAKQMYREKQ